MNIKNRKAFIGLPLVLLVVGIVFVVLVRFGIIKDPFPLKTIPFLQKQKEPKVSIKTKYNNPFDKKTQYVNPFEAYKNPFVVAK
ncbi:MAG: hypothetical protein AAB600_01690 [Patescibacteria group bacterium]